MMAILKRTMLLLLLILMTANVFGGTVFAENKQANFRIILPLVPTKTEKFAAAELKKFLSASYKQPIVLNGEKTPVTFMVGFSSEAIMAGFSGVKRAPGKFGIFRDKANFLFYGYDHEGVDPVKTRYYSTGTLSAVYYFLNKYIGVNFYFPGEKGYSLSPGKPLVFKGSQDIPEPTFEVRAFYVGTKEYSSEEMNIFSRRMLCHLPFWSKLDFYYIFMYRWKKRFWTTHPEYFMLRNGKRVSRIYPLHVPCLSNPEVIRQTAADIVAAINRKPEIKTVRIFCDAPIYQCQCARCKASPERKYCGKDSNVGEEVYGFQKKVMDLVRQAYPGTYLYSQTKGNSYFQPPKMAKMGKHFVMQILTSFPLPAANYDDFVKLVKKWNDAGAKTLLKCYRRYPAFKTYPIMNTRLLQKYLSRFVGVAKGTTHSDLRRKTPYMFSALGQYAQAKMLFNIKADIDELTANFCAFAYPGAKSEMIAFYQEMERLFAQCKSNWRDPLTDIYYPDKLKKAMTLLDAAAKKVKKAEFFNPLYANFKKFYDVAWKKKVMIDKLIKMAPEKTIALPLLKDKVDFAAANPAAWKGAVKEKLSPGSGAYKNFQPAYAFLGCNKKYLYIGLVGMEKYPQKLRRACKKNHAGAIWADDCFEVMLVTNPATATYYQIGVNSLGVYRVLFRAYGKQAKEDTRFKVETKAKIGQDNWTVQLKIPLANFSAADFQRVWKFNIFRSRYLNDIAKIRANFQSSGLRLLGRSYHNLYEYDNLTWPKEATPKTFWEKLKFWK